jgi:ribosomal protein L29
MAEKKIKARLGELRKMAEEDLLAAAEAARKNIYTIRRQRLSKPIENIKAIRTNRKEIARIQTIQRQREIAAAAPKSN